MPEYVRLSGGKAARTDLTCQTGQTGQVVRSVGPITPFAGNALRVLRFRAGLTEPPHCRRRGTGMLPPWRQHDPPAEIMLTLYMNMC